MKKLGLLLCGLVLMAQAQAAGDAGPAEASLQADETKEKIDAIEGKLGGLEESFLEVKSTVGKLSKLKVSGYMQAQFCVAETLGVATSKSGAKFDSETQTRFFIRRGRLKFAYSNGLSDYVLQFDASSGGFEIKDAYISLTEPWLRNFAATMGIFNRPFGYEIAYSSSSRESPERSRLFQTLFPKEQEIGAQLAFAAGDGPLSFLNVKGGVFNGVTPFQLENDLNKDVIGRIGFEFPLRDAGMGIDGGFSGYYGNVTNTDTLNGGEAYEMDGTGFVRSTGCGGDDFSRKYFGVDLQYYLDIPVIGGATLRGEYLWGLQPGTAKSSSFYQPSAGGVPNGAVYSRNFNGMYFYWVQCWGKKVQSVLKFDMYDPNVDVGGDDIGASGSYTTSTDLKFNTLGLGLIYDWDANVRLMAYYDMPKNETSENLESSNPYKDFSRNLPDNVFTLRVQYKF